MRGNDIIDEPLFPGTAKAAESHLLEVLFKRAKEEGCNVEVNWQDTDSCLKSTYTQAAVLAKITQLAVAASPWDSFEMLA